MKILKSYKQLFEAKNVITELNYSEQGLIELPKLLDGLINLYCNHNILDKLPTLPSTLEYLECSSNNLTKLPKLPNTLKHLACNYNHLTELPKIPEGLVYLSCIGNELTKLPRLPFALEELNLSSDNIPYTSLFGYWKWCKDNDIEHYEDYLLYNNMEKFNI